MILRLVFSFFFFSLVTGNKQFDDTTKKTARTNYCENNICLRQDTLKLRTPHHSSPSISTYHHKVIQGPQILTPTFKVKQTAYGYAPKIINSGPGHIISSPAERIEIKSFNEEVMSDNDGSSYQVPRPDQHVRNDMSEKTICFSPRLVHRMVKAALEYVSEIPADISKIVEQLEKELNKLPDSDSFEEHYITKSLYPLDSKSIFQMLKNTPMSGAKDNVILKYEQPGGTQEPQCKDALDKLIEIAYNAYSELEQHPQCRDYLYQFASHQQEDRPKGRLDYGPDMPSLVNSILQQVDKKRPKSPPEYHRPVSPILQPIDKQRPKSLPEYHRPDYDSTAEIDIPMPGVPISQVHEVQEITTPLIRDINKPQTQDYRIPQVPEIDIPEIHEIKIPQNYEMNIPQVHEIKTPQSYEINIPQNYEMNIPQVHEIKTPQSYEINIPQNYEMNIPQVHEIKTPQSYEINIPQNYEMNIPQVHEIKTPQSYEINIPQNYEMNIPQVHEIKTPQSYEINIPQDHEIKNPQNYEMNIPQIHEVNIPQVHELNIQQIPGKNIPQIHKIKIPQISEYNVPQIHEIKLPQISKYNVPQSHEIKIPQISKYNVPQSHEIKIPQISEYNVPQSHEIKIPQISEYNIPQIHKTHEINEYNMPQIHEYNIPQIPITTQLHAIEIPTIEEGGQETIPIQSDEMYDVLIDLLKNNDNSDNGDLYDRFMDIVIENENNFHPKVYKVLTTLLNKQKQQPNPNLDGIISFIIDSERKKQWPWGDKITDNILSLLIPDQDGNIDRRIVEIIQGLIDKPTNENQIEYIMSLLKPIKEGKLEPETSDIIINLIKANLDDLLLPEHIEILLKLLKPTRSGVDPKKINIVDNLSTWDKIGIQPNQLDKIITLLKPDINGNTDLRLIDIIDFLLSQNKYLSPKHLDFILSFLHPEPSGVVDTKRIDVIHLLLSSILQPKHVNVLLQLLEDNPQGVLNSRFLDILLYLNNNKLLTPDLVDTLIHLMINEITGKLDDNQVKSLFYQLAPFKQTNPKLVVDILTILNQGGLQGDVVKWLDSMNNKVDIPNRDSATPLSIQVHPIENLKIIDNAKDNQFRTPDDEHQTDDDFMAIMKWLESQGLLTADKGSNNDLVNNILEILNMGQHDLGVVELTYMLKHEKPLIYQPVYYVKYRLPILSFISNMKNLLVENPQLTSDPMKLLQELITVSNVTEVSPNLQGYPKEEILKLTVNDGDLVQAKILDEQNLNLNEQISYVHELNSDISPEELLQQNKINEAKYYPDVLKFQGTYPDKVTMHENSVIKFPTVHYHQVQVHPIVRHQTHTIHYTDRTNRKRIPPQHVNAQLRLLE